jgi:5-methylcytosine-specific restriction protein A
MVTARSPDGVDLRMRVRLCWRRDGRNPREQRYSALQLRARTIDGDWDKTLESIVDRDRVDEVTHTLAVQRDGANIVYAALIPREQLKAVWFAQRDKSAELIASGKLRRLRKNHAMNGQSPTLWLQDDREADTHAVADVLWGWPGVVDLAQMPVVLAGEGVDDTYDDCAGLDRSQLGVEGAERLRAMRSGFKRDHAVRAAVLARANNSCERGSCGTSRPYPGFLDVHHILGVEKSDRPWTCVALCPNCHREAHIAPDADRLNQELLSFAGRFDRSRRSVSA